jgi:hypothetical protein
MGVEVKLLICPNPLSTVGMRGQMTSRFVPWLSAMQGINNLINRVFTATNPTVKIVYLHDT